MESTRALRVLLAGFLLTWSLFFIAEDVRDFFTGDAYFSAIIGGSVMGAFAAYWTVALIQEARDL